METRGQDKKKTKYPQAFSSEIKSYKVKTQDAPERDSIRGKDAKTLAMAY